MDERAKLLCFMGVALLMLILFHSYPPVFTRPSSLSPAPPQKYPMPTIRSGSVRAVAENFQEVQNMRPQQAPHSGPNHSPQHAPTARFEDGPPPMHYQEAHPAQQANDMQEQMHQQMQHQMQMQQQQQPMYTPPNQEVPGQEMRLPPPLSTSTRKRDPEEEAREQQQQQQQQPSQPMAGRNEGMGSDNFFSSGGPGASNGSEWGSPL